MECEDRNIIRRVWMDGCFDLVHCGHADACRQAKLLADYLIVGGHSDEDIRINKGLPVSLEKERYKLLRTIRWVDEVVEGAPYVPTIETLEKYRCQFCVHGEEPALGIDGTDYHQPVRTAGRYKDLVRKLDISTSDIIQRILNTNNSCETVDDVGDKIEIYQEKISQFTDNRSAKESDKIIYTTGAFDLFHVGHVDFLERAKLKGDYLIVGVYSDKNAQIYRDGQKPILNVYERSLSVAACRFVDEVIIDPSYKTDEEFIRNRQISLVVCGKKRIEKCSRFNDPYEVARTLGLFELVDSTNRTSTKQIVDRVLSQRSIYEERNLKKRQNELQGLINFQAKTH